MRKFFLIVSVFMLPSFYCLAADPTQPPGWLSGSSQKSAPAVSKKKLKLQQVLIREDSRLAVINNRLVKAGDRISGARVVEIKPGSVVVKISQKRVVLSLLNNTKMSVNRPESRK